MSRSRTAGLSVAIFGAMSVLGQEIRRLLEEDPIGVSSLGLYEGGDLMGSLTEFEGEAFVVTAPEEESAGRADVAFICGEEDPRSGTYLDWVRRGEGVAIDLAGASAGREGVPMIHCDVNPEALRPGVKLVSAPHAIAHPLTSVLHVLGRSFTLTDGCVTVLRPVSDGGKRAVEELHQQTVGVLSFAQVPTEVFGRQMAFNLLPQAIQGESGRPIQDAVRLDVERVLGASCPPLSVRILQAPVFYGHGYLLRVSMDERAAPADLSRALEQSGLFRISRDSEERTPVELASRPGVWIADVSGDGARAGSFWLWMVTDAIRGGAAPNGVRLARMLSEARP